MPYRWLPPEGDTGCRRLEIRPHRSLGPRGFVTMIGLTLALASVPLLAVLGSVILWVLLPFMAAAIGGLWWALSRNTRDRLAQRETLCLTRQQITLTHASPHHGTRSWSANPYWVRVRLAPTGGPVPDYLTLAGGDREVELGACLSAPERRALAQDLREALAGLR